MTKTKNFWNGLTSTLWFVPALFAVCGVLLGILLVAFDYFIGSPFSYLSPFFGVQPSVAAGGCRALWLRLPLTPFILFVAHKSGANRVPFHSNLYHTIFVTFLAMGILENGEATPTCPVTRKLYWASW